MRRGTQKDVFGMLKEAQFSDRFSGKINDHQAKVLARMFAPGPDGFDGGMSAEK